ncbi:hypothetical protein SM995_01270, partial [Escherichia coli]|nr:hypothetical protein [Escherichia coli]
GTADRNRSHWSTSKTPSYTKSVSWHHHPVVVEVILERVTNISMGSELDNVMEFEDIADNAADAPTETCFMHYE